jgi:hypothetical protein
MPTRTPAAPAPGRITLARTVLLASVLLLAAAGFRPETAGAQIVWDTPRLIGPDSPSGLGVYWMRAGARPGDEDAFFGTWSLPGFDGAVVLRGGAGEGVGGETAAFGGVDVHAPIARARPGQPLDLEWNAGAGFGVGQYLLVSVPMGVSAGHSWTSGSVWLAPYVFAGAALEFRTGDEAPDEEFKVEATGGLGVDLSFDPSRRFVLRASAALGERQAVAVGFVVRAGS